LNVPLAIMQNAAATAIAAAFLTFMIREITMADAKFKYRSAVTQTRLREVLTYDPATGVFRWKNNTRATRAGQIAGCVFRGRYIAISVDSVKYLAHRLAWLYIHGAWPSVDVDHRDGDGFNNRISNLREAVNTINPQNIRRRRQGLPGLLGTRFNGRLWQSLLWVDGRQRYLGGFSTEQEAHSEYVRQKRIHHEGCTL
jgi:hypothetical protein